MGPMNYALDVQQPFQAALQGFQAGNAMRQVADQRAQAEQQQASQLAMQTDLAAAAKDQRLLPGLMVKYPQLSEQLKRGWDVMSAEQQRGNMEHAAQVYAALSSGRPDVAQQTLRDRAAALRNSGDEQGAKTAEDMARWSEMDPESLKTSVGLRLAALPGGDKVIEGAVKLGTESRAAAQAPAALRKAEADATGAEAEAKTKGVTAKFAESNALKDLETKGWNIKALQADIDFKKQSSRIAAMNAAIAKEGNALKKQELQIKVDEAIAARDTKVRERTAEYETGQATLQDALNLLTEIRADPDTLAAATGAGAWRGAIPGTKSRTAAGKIEQLQNTLAASNLDKLKGAMSDKDIAFLKNIASNLDRYQDEDKFAEELGKVENILIRSDQQLRQKFGAPKRQAPSAEPSATGTVQRNVVVDW